MGAPLRAVILARTGQDVRRCAACDLCTRSLLPGMDLTFGQLLQAVIHDEEKALRASTLWESDDLLIRHPKCLEDLDLAAILLTLQDEAVKRGLAPEEGN